MCISTIDVLLDSSCSVTSARNNERVVVLCLSRSQKLTRPKRERECAQTGEVEGEGNFISNSFSRCASGCSSSGSKAIPVQRNKMNNLPREKQNEIERMNAVHCIA
jgi:hypothetical protein